MTNSTVVDIVNDYYKEAAAYHGFTGNVSSSSGFALTIRYFKQHYPELWTSVNIQLIPAELPGFVGGYPHNSGKERGVDAVMIVLMFLVFCLHLFQFIRNRQVGHIYWPTVPLLAHCLFAMIGWGCRIGWSLDISDFHLGIASYILITVTEYLLPLTNWFFAFTFFDYFHPGARNRKAVSWHKLGPAVGAVSFVMCIVAPSLQYYQYFEYSTLTRVQQVQLAGGILGVIFHMAPVSLVIAALCKKVKEPAKGECLSQPYWITSFGPFDRFRPQAIPYGTTRTTIPMRKLPGKGKFRMAHDQMLDGPSVKYAVLLIIPSALLLWSATLMRTLSIGYANSGYMAEYVVSSDPLKLKDFWFPSSVEAIWVFYGGVQTFVLLLWFIFRIDLRFYVPLNKAGADDLELVEDGSV